MRTSYSYNVAGDVTSVVTDIPETDAVGADRVVKRTDYVRNAGSGELTRKEYQKGKEADQYFWKYGYDASGRLTHLWSSREGLLWDQDRKIDYDSLGTVVRETIGEDSVQAVDYTYTLQGQLKGINHPSLSVNQDPGLDGKPDSPHARVGADVFGMALTYFGGDYMRTAGTGGTASVFNQTESTMPSLVNGLNPNRELYGGLPVSVATRTQANPRTISQFQFSGQLVGEGYDYDVLGRIDATAYYTRSSISGGTPEGTGWDERDGIFKSKAYSSSFLYDPNGNQVAYVRTVQDPLTFSSVQVVDDVTVDLESGTSNAVNVIHESSGVAGYDDVKAETNVQSSVDKVGRTTLAQTGAGASRTLTWNSFDGVSTAASGIMTSTFLYDGNRQPVRISITESGVTRHVYNVNGGEIVYDLTGAGTPSVREWLVAGGADRRTGTSAELGDVRTRHMGYKRYELTDHLGSVRAVVTDMKLNVSGAFKSEPYAVAEYDVYGQRRPYRSADMNSPDIYSYGFQGMRRAEGILPTLSNTGNDYTTAFRLYDARKGMWLSHDPIHTAGASPYEGLGSNPVVYTDPLGLQASTLSTPLSPQPKQKSTFGKILKAGSAAVANYFLDGASSATAASREAMGDLTSTKSTRTPMAQPQMKQTPEVQPTKEYGAAPVVAEKKQPSALDYFKVAVAVTLYLKAKEVVQTEAMVTAIAEDLTPLGYFVQFPMSPLAEEFREDYYRRRQGTHTAMEVLGYVETLAGLGLETAAPIITTASGGSLLPLGAVAEGAGLALAAHGTGMSATANAKSKREQDAHMLSENNKPTTGGTGKTSNPNKVGANARKMSPEEIGDFLDAGKDWHGTSAKNDFLGEFKKELKGDHNADFFVDKTTKEVFLKSNKSQIWVKTGLKLE